MNVEQKVNKFFGWVVLLAIGFWLGLFISDHVDGDEQPIQNCPHGHICRWEAIDTATGACVKNCDVRP